MIQIYTLILLSVILIVTLDLILRWIHSSSSLVLVAGFALVRGVDVSTGFSVCVCPKSILGAHLAEVSLFLSISNILASFDIGKEVDADGTEIEPSIEWIGGAPSMFANPLSFDTSVFAEPKFFRHLKPFKCRIRARSSFVVELINAL